MHGGSMIKDTQSTTFGFAYMGHQFLNVSSSVQMCTMNNENSKMNQGFVTLPPTNDDVVIIINKIGLLLLKILF